ncbi:MAG: DUF58 domain-containing protein [Pseudomonadota bacterium]
MSARRERLLRFYDRLNRLDDWFAMRLTDLGRLILWATVAAGLFGINQRRSYAYQLFALFLVLLLLGLLIGRSRRAHAVDVVRELPAFATVGEPFQYHLRVRHTAAGLQVDVPVWLRERLQSRPARPEGLVRYYDPVAPRRRYRFAFVRWIRYTRYLQGARTKGQHALLESRLNAAGGTRIPLSLTPLRRGYVQFEALQIGMAEPLSISRRVEVRRLPGQVLVLPARFEIADRLLPGAGRGDTAHGGLLNLPGFSDEFLGVREYRSGDSMRHIHWKRTAAIGEPVVREFMREASRRYAVVLDSCGVRSGDPAFEESVSVAASLLQHAFGHHGGADLITLEQSFIDHGLGSLDLETLLGVLAVIDGEEDVPVAELTSAALREQHRIRAAVLVLHTFDAARGQLVDTLRDAGLELQVIVIQGATDHDDSAAPMPAGVACERVPLGQAAMVLTA